MFMLSYKMFIRFYVFLCHERMHVYVNSASSTHNPNLNLSYLTYKCALKQKAMHAQVHDYDLRKIALQS